MRVVEKFISINGEGTRAGELAVFVRFQGCNLNCSYCDTAWANEPGQPYTQESPEEICRFIVSTGVRNVTLTGGEPLLQEEMQRLLSLLSGQDGVRLEIETNGSVSLRPYCEDARPAFTMDYKLPSSGFEGQMNCENFSLLQASDTVKFVVGTNEDLGRALEIIREYDLTRQCHVYLSPVFGKIEPEQIVDFMKEHMLNDVRIQLQLHKLIWDPEKRGV